MPEEIIAEGLSGDLDILDTASESEDIKPEETEDTLIEEPSEETSTPEAKTEGEDEEEKEPELSKDEEVLEAGEDEKEEEGPLGERPLKGMKAKYPKVFKDFPALKQAWYSSREFYDVFPSVQAAKEAAERSKVLAEVEQDIFKEGSSKELLNRVKQGNAESFQSFVGSFLDNVRELDADQYTRVVTPMFDHLVSHLHTEGQRLNNDEVKKAAQIVYGMIHPNTQYGSSISQTPNKEVEKLEKAKKNFEQEKTSHFNGQYQSAQQKVLGRVETAVKANVTRSLSKLEVSGYLKDNITSDVLDEVFSNLKQDGEFQSSQSSLWDTAANDQFSEGTLAKIVDAALRRVSKVLPRIRGEVRNKALGGNVKDSQESTTKKTTSSGGRRKRVSSAKDIREMSDLDVLSDDVVVS